MSEDWLFLEHLVKSAVLTADQFKAALAERHRTRTTLREALVHLGLLDKAGLVRHWVAFFNIPQLDLASQVPSDAAIVAIPRELCLRYTALPLELTTEYATVAMADPTHLDHLEDLRFLLNLPIRPALAPAEAIRAAIERHCPPPPEIFQG